MLTKTEKAIIAQLIENTGIALCDSGGAYGRNWERNQSRKFTDEPESTLEFTLYRDGELGISVTHNVFHWLNERVEYDGDMTRRFKNFARRKLYEDSGWMEIAEAFSCLHGNRVQRNGECRGYGAINTYNGNDLLSQTLQYYHWYSEEGEFIVLQVHGGCDVRGGYTTPKVYRTWDSMFDNARATVICPECRARWRSDEGYYWEPEGLDIELPCNDPSTGSLFADSDLPERAEFPLLNLSARTMFKGQDNPSYAIVQVDEFPPECERERGTFYITHDGAGLCPCCQKGTLIARCM